MKNYNKFIDELNTLVITTKERFVTKEGQILYGECNQPDPQYYPVESDAKLNPNYYRATFLNLDRYNLHNDTDRYADLLQRLSDRAKTDVLLLNNKKAERILADAVKKRDRLTRLLGKAIEFMKALRAGTLDDPLYLELQILDCFIIPNRPKASYDERFAHNLYEAIMYKRGSLSGFIKQIEKHLGTDAENDVVTESSDAPTVTDVPTGRTEVGTLEDYIKEDYRAILLPFLIDNYSRNKQSVIVPMLFALDSLGVTHPKVSSAKKSTLYKAVSATLSNIGSESGFNTSMRNYNGTYYAKDVYDEAIEPHKRKIKEVLGL